MGTGTAFTTDLKAGDFIVFVVGGTGYTLPVKSIASNAQLTLSGNYTGPTQSNISWFAVPREAQSLITAGLASQITEALRGLNADKYNWQQVFSEDANITVRLPDGSEFTGPSWKYLSDNMATKSGGAVPVNQGGTGATTRDAALSNLGITYVRSGTNSSVIKIGDIYQMDFLIGGGIAVGAYNPQTVGGITYYTHYYKVPLPVALPNGIITSVVSISGDRFGNQTPGYNADVKTCRDKDDGTGLSTTYLTVSVKTPQTGWFPYFHVRVVGY
ncbi:hypothetical protein AGJ19_23120 [Cronobacter sakazakii]|nr:hypothetical protein [Cronobacter sakazakii]EJG0831792.1 hypothetical protein [Cronobacter sakazakii]